MVDLQPSRLEIAKRLGAAVTVLAANIKQEHFKTRFSVVIDATGAPPVVEELPWYTRDRGTILLFGVCPSRLLVNYPPYEVYYRELTILGSYSLNGELPQAVALLAAGKIPTKEVVTHRISLDDVPSHLSGVPAI
jgi:threonine dehydrogenase-like Zn-dependent dehydrogenase